MSNKFLLADEGDAIRVVRAMSEIIAKDGRVTVADVHNLLGLSSVYIDEQMGWKTTNHVLQPANNGNVSLEFPEPIDFRLERRKPCGTIRLTMLFDDSEEMEQALATFLSVNTLRTAAREWSVSKRVGPPFPRINYTPRAYGSDDI